jgi:hypothetical protein
MPAYVRPDYVGELVVVFSRIGQEDETRRVTDGRDAAIKAVNMIVNRLELLAGDMLTVRKPDDIDSIEEVLSELPEVSRASHMS